MKIEKVYIGGWFQRTTLHLTEVWDLIHHQKSKIGFSDKQLRDARKNLAIETATRESNGLEYLAVQTKLGISFRFYEDGLVILEKNFSSLKSDFEKIKDYYDNRFSKTISLLFSKGAPVPKELANIQTILPYIVTIADGSRQEIEQLFKNFKEEIYSVIKAQNTEVYRSPGIIVIHNLKDKKLTREVVETQIFFREFKSQLHRYLTIHRIIWEKIGQIKEKGAIKGTQIDEYRNTLGDYQKTITLIDGRIEQMGTYLRTRQKLMDLKKVDGYLNPLFQLKFETLADTHEYIKHLWDMTKNYLNSAIEVFVELQNKSTKNSISALQTVTTIGVVAAILGYLTRDQLPHFTTIGLTYFILLLAMTWLLNNIISRIYKSKKYKIKGSDIIKNIN